MPIGQSQSTLSNRVIIEGLSCRYRRTKPPRRWGEIARTEQRSAEAQEYANASPNFLLWGLIWMVGYTGSHLLPNYGFVGAINWLWFGLTIIGVTGGRLIGRHQYRHRSPEQQAAGRAISFRIGMSSSRAFSLSPPPSS